MWSSHDEAHHHYRRYRKAELRDLSHKLNFDRVLLSYFNTLLFPLIAAARIGAKVLGREGSHETLPPEPINSVLRGVFSREQSLVGRVPLPFGVSLVAVLRKPGLS
jgi:hypothetical protein